MHQQDYVRTLRSESLNGCNPDKFTCLRRITGIKTVPAATKCISLWLSITRSRIQDTAELSFSRKQGHDAVRITHTKKCYELGEELLL